jgi:dipeptidyl aminopeptidase/acylaminoacyl peptidase
LQGSEAKALIDERAVEVTKFVFNDFSNVALGVQLGGGRPEVRWLDEQARQRAEALNKTFHGGKVRTVSHSQDFSRVVVEFASSTAAPTLYLVDFASGKAEIVGEPYPELAKAPLPRTEQVSYSAEDGKTLLADLTLPTSGEARNLPAIVLSHDGPEDQDYDQFDWLVRFLVSRGYAVLQPQFSGSTNSTTRHDIADAARFLVSRGIADQRRVCVIGTGYGAHAALAGATLGPVGMFSCAVGINGIYGLSNYLSYLDKHLGERSLRLQYWRDRIGNPADAQVSDSALTRAARLTPIPVLLIHADEDTVTPLAQSEQLSRSMAGRPVRLLALANDDHYLSNASTRLALLNELGTFLTRTLAITSP